MVFSYLVSQRTKTSKCIQKRRGTVLTVDIYPDTFLSVNHQLLRIQRILVTVRDEF